MTDTSGANGPGTGSEPAGGTPAAAAEPASDNRTAIGDGAGDDGSNVSFSDLVAGLEKDNRTFVEAKNWGSVDDVLKSHRELESHVGKALVPPGENASAEDWDKFYTKLGRPEKPEGYELKVDRENLPADFPYDQTMAVEFRNWAHAAGMTPAQAQRAHDGYVGFAAKQYEASQEALANEQAAAHREITQKWGEPDSEGYKRGVEKMTRAARELGISDALKKGGLLTPDGGIRDAKLAFALEKVGQELYSEDVFATGDGAALDNPFSDDKPNLTKQGQIIRSDPNKARALIRAAGKDPATYGMKP